ncbi:hypothetical protein [Salmonirosea aquatica]|uniref:Uncharacterized protein n=1 Tax=Salmonirosea aquatica TaxID=2654236 RepID=A0A7C9B862_9BACT|nr:hypothetical protein [Cytophagaceae bacterium SJW1-29]
MSQKEEREFLAQKQKIRQLEATIKELKYTVDFQRYALNNSQKIAYETNLSNGLALKILREAVGLLNNKTNIDPMGIYVKTYHLLNRN